MSELPTIEDAGCRNENFKIESWWGGDELLLKGQSSANLSISQEMHPLLSATSCHYLHLLVIMRMTSLSLPVNLSLSLLAALPLSATLFLSMSATSCHYRDLLVIMRIWLLCLYLEFYLCLCLQLCFSNWGWGWDDDENEDVDEDAKRYAASCHYHHLLVIMRVRMRMRVNSEWTLSILAIYICEPCKLQVGELRKLATFIKIPGKCYLGEK